jgi:hypothetical protein
MKKIFTIIAALAIVSSSAPEISNASSSVRDYDGYSFFSNHNHNHVSCKPVVQQAPTIANSYNVSAASTATVTGAVTQSFTESFSTASLSSEVLNGKVTKENAAMSAYGTSFGLSEGSAKPLSAHVALSLNGNLKTGQLVMSGVMDSSARVLTGSGWSGVLNTGTLTSDGVTNAASLSSMATAYSVGTTTASTSATSSLGFSMSK